MQGPIKIGCSVAPDGRRASLECWSPFPLELLAEIAGTEKLERRFHGKFIQQHIGHEWFSWSPELQETVEAVAAGTFDIETLPPPVPLTGFMRKPRDNSYSTPGWRYGRSVIARVQNMRERGLSWDEASRSGVFGLALDKATDEQVAAVRKWVEPLIAEWRARYPAASDQRRTPRKAA